MRTLALAAITCLLLVFLPVQAEEAQLEIRSAWIPEAPPNARMLAGYLDVTNRSDVQMVIIGARSPAFGRVEIHRTKQVDGVARMRKQDRVEIPPGETVRFEPGDLHLMLMHPDRQPGAGDEIKLYLIDEDGREFPFTAEVRKRS